MSLACGPRTTISRDQFAPALRLTVPIVSTPDWAFQPWPTIEMSLTTVPCTGMSTRGTDFEVVLSVMPC